METKISKTQQEVWEWKEKAWHQIKDMPLDKGIEFVLNQTQDMAQEIKSRKQERVSKK